MAKKVVEMTQQSVKTDPEMDAEPSSDVAAGDARGTTSASSAGASPGKEVSAATDASASAHDSAVEATVERRSKRPRTASADKPSPLQQVKPDSCDACGAAAIGSEPSLALLKCSSCQVHVHARCYVSSARSRLDDPSAPWTCDSCRDVTSPRDATRVCVFCLQSGGACMRRVDTTRWPASYRAAVSTSSETAWAHAMCALWDPFHSIPAKQDMASASTDEPVVGPGDAAVEPATAQRSKRNEDMSVSKDAFRARLQLPVPACSFCDRAEGVRIQCRHLHCGRFFHVRCAHASDRGHVEVVHTPFLLKHAYCDRHRESRHDVRGLATKLTSKTVASLVPRDVATKLQGIARRLDSYASVDAVFVDLVHVLEEQCKKGFKNSKTDPPTFSMRQLQALQLVLDHLPQLRNVYELTTLSKADADLVQDADVAHALQKAFHPQRFVRKFAGPLSQFHQCDACHEPFQERQHVFYCTSTERTHALHWKCTKRKSAAKDSRQGGSGGSKKKAKSLSLVQQGHWKDIKLPKGLPSIGDGVTCSVCRASVDARGLLAGRKEATRMDFEKPASEFMFGGCFANEMDPRTAAAAGLRSSRATLAGGAHAGAVSATRTLSKAAPRRSASGASVLEDSDGESSALLGPPKLDRINVRRTMRWLACLGQVIRLILAAKKKAREAAAGPNDKEEMSTREQADADKGTTEPEAEVQVEISEMGAKDVDMRDSNPAPSVAIENQALDEKQATPAGVAAADTQATELPPVSSELMEMAPTCKEVAPVTTALEEPETNEAPPLGIAVDETRDSIPTPPVSTLPAAALAYLEEAKNVVRPYDAYALGKMESAHRMLEERSGPALSVLNTLIQEYTRFMYMKHTRAVAKASNEKRKREELEAQEERERERKRIDREAELALKKQMLAMRKKQRT